MISSPQSRPDVFRFKFLMNDEADFQKLSRLCNTIKYNHDVLNFDLDANTPNYLKLSADG